MAKRLNRWTSFLGVLAMVCHMLFFGQSVMAADSYPYADVPCIYAPYNVQSRRAGWCANYDFGRRHNDRSAANVISPYGYYYRNCTDYVAWRLAGLGVLQAQYRGLGNAKQWARPAAKHGLRVDSQPAVHAAGVRTSGAYGHVALVEALDVPGYPAGSIKVSEYNKGADGNYGERTGTPAQLGLTHFVHFEDYIPVPIASPAPEPPVAPVLPDLPAQMVPAPDMVTTTSAPTLALPGTELSVSGAVDTNAAEAAATPMPDTNAAPAPMPDASASVSPDESGVGRANDESAMATSDAAVSPSPVDVVGGQLAPVAEPVAIATDVPLLAANLLDAATPTSREATKAIEQPEAIVPAPEPVPQRESAVSAAVLATALPVPHKWWQEITASPPATVDSLLPPRGTVHQAAAQAGIWVIGGLMLVLILQHYGLMRDLGIRLRRWPRM